MQVHNNISGEEWPTFLMRTWSLIGSIKQNRTEKVWKHAHVFNVINLDGVEFGYYTTLEYFVFFVGDEEYRVSRNGMNSPQNIPVTIFEQDKILGELSEYIEDYFLGEHCV